MNNLIKRAISGSLYVGLVIVSLLLESSVLYLLLVALFAFIGIWEYSELVGVNRTRPMRSIFDGLMAAMFVVAPILGAHPLVMLVFGAYLMFVLVRSIYSSRELQPEEVCKTIFGQIYVTLPILALAMLYWDFGTEVVLMGFVAIWANDTGAYLAGSALGKRKLFPSVSPNKSWEGFYGGVIASVIVCYVFTRFGEDLYISPVQSVGIGILISLFATWGDLFESLLKRRAGVKDSGNILPGHGGILDRIDSVLFVMPMLWLVLTALGYMSLSSGCMF